MRMNVHQMHKQYTSDLLTAREAAQILPSTSAATVSRWARDRKIASVRLPNGRVFFEREVIENLPVYREPAYAAGSLPEDRVLPCFSASGGGSGVRSEEASVYVNSSGVA